MHFLRHGVQGIDVTHLSDKVIAFSSDCSACIFFLEGYDENLF